MGKIKTETLLGWIVPGIMFVVFSVLVFVMRSTAADEARELDKEIYKELATVKAVQIAQELKINSIQIDLKHLKEIPAKVEANHDLLIQIVTKLEIEEG